ncbi:MAG: metallophosphoesterase, partial [Pseudolysinimonas sp.]
EPAAKRMNAQVIWVMGNHDERPDYSRLLFDEESDAPQDRVYDIDGLRIISFDTTVPGYHHGDVTDDQLDWLADVLASPAPHGTLLAVHHPPIPTPLLEAMGMLELQRQVRLAEVIRGTDVRGILAGHLHYSTHSTFAGIPVSVASATCYTLDLSAKDRLLSGVDFGQSVNVVHVYDEQVVHSIIPIGDTPEVSGFSADAWAQIEAMSPEQRLATFSAKNSTFNSAEVASSGEG